VIWLPDAVTTRMAQQSPDFWGWRSGVFEFEADPSLHQAFHQDSVPLPLPSPEPNDQPTYPIADLQQEIATLEAQSPNSPLLITLYSDLGNAHRQQHDYDAALATDRNALNRAELHKNKSWQARSLRNIGRTLHNSGRYERAIAFFEQSLEIQRQIKDCQGEAVSLSGLGNAYDSLGDYEQAIAFHEQSLEIQRQIKDRQGEANSLFNMANAYLRLDRRWDAQVNFEAALALFQDMGLQHRVKQCQNALYQLGKRVVVQRIEAPAIPAKQVPEDDWWERSLPTNEAPQSPQRSSTSQWEQYGVWFLVGLAIALLIWWLR
jgi:tetratricopeptide (TPR) repeat protein